MNKEYLMSLFELKYSDYHNKYFVKNPETKEQLENIIEKIMVRYELEIAELKAKVYTYEKIIANSNFSPILKEVKKKEVK